jgi:LPXTG-motif cell wall-anchored protein
MKTLQRLIATIVAGILSFPYLVVAQDQGTYIDNLGVQDSSYMEQDMLAEGVQGSGSGTVVWIIIAVIILIAVVAFFVKRRKK